MTFVQENTKRGNAGKQHMIIYSVTITIEASIQSEWLNWMTSVHIGDVLKTGCFSECRMHKMIGSDGDKPTYVMQYRCRSLEDYHRYQNNFAPALQKEHTARFSGRFRGSRLVMEETATFPPTGI